jgi:hypothetical protein
MWPAQHIDRLMAGHNVRPGDIKEALTRRFIRVRHLERLRVPHDLPPLEAKRRAAKGLVLKVQPYVRTLEVLAEAIGVPAEETIFEAFRSTSYGRANNERWEQTAVHLHWYLQEMTRGVIGAAHLQRYFQLRHQANSGSDFFDLHDSFPSTDQVGYEGQADVCWADFGLPTVPLLRLSRATFKGQLSVERKVLGAKKLPLEEAVRLSSDLGPLGPTDLVDAELSLFSDIRLAVGPTSRMDRIGPLFQRRSFVELKTGGATRPLTFPYSLFPMAEGHYEDGRPAVAAQFEDGWRRITGFGVRWSGSIPIEENFGRELDDDLFFETFIGEQGWERELGTYLVTVSPATVAQLLDLFTKPGRQVLFDANSRHPKPTFCNFPKAKVLEIALYTGAIEELLFREARELQSELDARIEEQTTVREREESSLIARWRQMARG